jgi:hypothetical protein
VTPPVPMVMNFCCAKARGGGRPSETAAAVSARVDFSFMMVRDS